MRSSGVGSSYYTTLGIYVVKAGVFWLSLVAVSTAVVATHFTKEPSSTTTTAATITLDTKDNALFLDTKAMKNLLEEDDEDDQILQATQAMRLELRSLRQHKISKHRQQRR